MKQLLAFLIVLFSLNCFAQNQSINIELKKQLDTILLTDQGFREFSDTEVSEKRKDTLALLLGYTKSEISKQGWKLVQRSDSTNLAKVERIIAKYGYPGKSIVGEPTNTAVFYTIQHSGKIDQYYPIIEAAGKAGELPFRFVAMMLDRKLANENKEQVYGTQVYMRTIKNPKTGNKEPFEYVVPIKDPKNVNKRRKDAGFDSTVEANAKRLGIVYKPYTLEEIKQILSTGIISKLQSF
ncbi:putative lactoylglutathione lyase [Pedobacter sp. UYP24]